MYAHNVRACTLYVGQQVCACLHPVRGVYREDEYVRTKERPTHIVNVISGATARRKIKSRKFQLARFS